MASLVVTEADTALAMRSGDVAVLATPRLVALCEEACVALVTGLPPERTTVGTRIEIDHLKATPVGGSVTTEATLQSDDGKRLEFEVVAVDGDGDEVGRARHWRAVVRRDRFA